MCDQEHNSLLLTEDPAQKGQEFRIGVELLRERAPNERATMEQPSTSCSNPRESSGRPGSSAGRSRDREPDMRDADMQRGGRIRNDGSASWEANDTPGTGQHEPGRTTGRDIGDYSEKSQNKPRILDQTQY
ncbi:hypothetical protein DPEC_G00257750 [Dallia pectoralis]|uniref:Uncharacterized protein n=1 Tax=Dallia pectoralis TaxID=75939 RepID=A0ACC2FQV1_DALPE|nr:hypothetical protein DPEC_G00257750 [Dallia pectoralis]